MNKVLSILFLVLVPTWLFAATPVVFFSDLTDGPTTGWHTDSSTKGAAVSIWGLNFGTSGSVVVKNITGTASTVTIPSTSCAEWAATTNPTTARGLQRITFWLTSSMNTDGTGPNSTIQVTTSDGTSNAITFHCRALGSNHIYFFDDEGDDSTGDGSYASPWQTGQKARASLAAGDIGYFREGTYTTIDPQYTPYGSFIYTRSDGTPNHNNGSANNTITIASYPTEQAQIGAYNNNTLDIFFRHDYGNIRYWTISKFKSIANKHAIALKDSSAYDTYIRIVGNDLRTRYAYTGTGYIISSQVGANQTSSGLKILGNYLNKAGRPSAPADAPTITTGTGTGLTGAYNAKYLYARLNGTGDYCYSDLSPAASEAVTLSNGALRVSWPEAYAYETSHPFTHVLIYRTKAGGSTYYYDQTVSYTGAGSVDTTTADDSLGSEDVPFGYKTESMYIQGYTGGGDPATYTDIEVAFNEIAYCNGPGQFYGHSINDEITLLKFYNNYVHHCGSQLVFGGGDPGTGDEYDFIKTAYIYNNIITDTGGASRITYPSGKGWHGGDFYIYNNTWYNIGTTNMFIVSDPDSYVMKNNIVYSLASSGGYFTYEVAGLTGDAPGTCSGDHNLWYGQGNGPDWSTTGDVDNDNPDFTSATPTTLSGFFPTAASPTVGAGTAITYAQSWDTYDFYGISRGSTWDIGAFEYTDGGSSPSTPSITGVMTGIIR